MTMWDYFFFLILQENDSPSHMYHVSISEIEIV